MGEQADQRSEAEQEACRSGESEISRCKDPLAGKGTGPAVKSGRRRSSFAAVDRSSLIAPGMRCSLQFHTARDVSILCQKERAHKKEANDGSMMTNPHPRGSLPERYEGSLRALMYPCAFRDVS